MGVDWSKPVKLATSETSGKIEVDWNRLMLLGALPITRVVLVLCEFDVLANHDSFNRMFWVSVRGELPGSSSFPSSFFAVADTIILTPRAMSRIGGPEAPMFTQSAESLRRLPQKRIVFLEDSSSPLKLEVEAAVEIRYLEGATLTPDLLDPPGRPDPNGSIYSAKDLLRVLPSLLQSEAQEFKSSFLAADPTKRLVEGETLDRAQIDPQDQSPSDGSLQGTAARSSATPGDGAFSAPLSPSSLQPSPPTPNGPDEYFAQVRGEWVRRLNQAESFAIFGHLIREYLKKEPEYEGVIDAVLKLQEALRRAEGSDNSASLPWH